VALALHDWLPSVIQAVKPYMSSESIEKGTRWGQDIGQALESFSVGIICLTPDNLTAPWISFEAGALSKSLDASRVMPLLLGLNRSDVPWPLAQFQLTVHEQSDIKKLIDAINRSAGPEAAVPEAVLSKSFNQFWPELDERLTQIATTAQEQRGVTPNQGVDQDAVLEELLDLARSQQRLLAEVSPGLRLLGRPNRVPGEQISPYLRLELTLFRDVLRKYRNHVKHTGEIPASAFVAQSEHIIELIEGLLSDEAVLVTPAAQWARLEKGQPLAQSMLETLITVEDGDESQEPESP
jgi:hypothetical protein